MSSVTVVIPVKDEAQGLPMLFERLTGTAESSPRHEFSFLFVNDGSSDGSDAILDDLAARHAYVQVIHLSRNFGHQMAVTAGIDHTDSDYVALIDADLQDPPELLVEMIGVLEEGHDVVYGQRLDREGETVLKRLTAKLFYRLLSAVTRVEIPHDTGDFRVMSRNVVQVLQGMRERHRFIRGMVAWVGFRARAFPYHREARVAGETKYSYSKMLRFALDALFSFSNVPLQLANYLGILVAALGGLGMGYIAVLEIFYDEYIPGVSPTLFSVL
ncbi:MAG: glycosyltransferase family 2 protein, partial [Acidobacteriota bacterium]